MRTEELDDKIIYINDQPYKTPIKTFLSTFREDEIRGDNVYFFRNVRNVYELSEKTKIAIIEKHRPQRFKIVDRVVLDEKDFLIFQNCFIQTYDFIKDISYKLTMNTSYEYLCLLVISRNFNYGFLVNSSGYPYARNIAFVNTREKEGK